MIITRDRAINPRSVQLPRSLRFGVLTITLHRGWCVEFCLRRAVIDNVCLSTLFGELEVAPAMYAFRPSLASWRLPLLPLQLQRKHVWWGSTVQLHDPGVSFGVRVLAAEHTPW